MTFKMLFTIAKKATCGGFDKLYQRVAVFVFKRFRTTDDGQALPFAVMVITVITVLIAGGGIGDDSPIQGTTPQPGRNARARRHRLGHTYGLITSRSYRPTWRQLCGAPINNQVNTDSGALRTTAENAPPLQGNKAIAKEQACWRVIDLEAVTGATRGGVATDTIITSIETRAGCHVGVDDLNAIPSQCKASDYIVSALCTQNIPALHAPL